MVWLLREVLAANYACSGRGVCTAGACGDVLSSPGRRARCTVAVSCSLWYQAMGRVPLSDRQVRLVNGSCARPESKGFAQRCMLPAARWWPGDDCLFCRTLPCRSARTTGCISWHICGYSSAARLAREGRHCQCASLRWLKAAPSAQLQEVGASGGAISMPFILVSK